MSQGYLLKYESILVGKMLDNTGVFDYIIHFIELRGIETDENIYT